MNEFLNKVIIVSGASSGIGKGIAESLLKEGAIVIGLGIDYKDLDFKYYQVDICNVLELKKVFDDIKENYDSIYGLVNCVGISNVGNLESLSNEDFVNEMNINVNGIFNVCKEAIVLMKNHESSIVNLASDLGIKPINDRIGYCPSKAALIMMTKCIALDYAPFVRANCVLPGIVKTPMTENRFLENPDLESIYASMYLANRIGSIDDMYNATKFLLSNKSSFISGISLPVCSGGDL